MSSPNPPVRYTRTAEVQAPGGKQDLPLPAALVVLESAGLSASDRAAAARASGIDPALLDKLCVAGLPIPLASAGSAAEAKLRLAELQGNLPAAKVVDPERLTPKAAMLAPLAALLLTLPLMLTGLWLLIPVLWVVGLGVMVAGLVQGSRAKTGLKEALELTQSRRAPMSASARKLLSAIAGLRSKLGGLHALVAQDLGESLVALEADLLALAEREAREGEDAVREAYAAIAESLTALEAALTGGEAGPELQAADRLKQQAKALRAMSSELGGKGPR